METNQKQAHSLLHHTCTHLVTLAYTCSHLVTLVPPQEIHEIEERKNSHINELMKKHERAFAGKSGLI